MYSEAESMKELHKIREQMHKETKGMGIDEKIGYINRIADATETKYKLNLRKVTHAHK
jgi:hypothetical protein